MKTRTVFVMIAGGLLCLSAWHPATVGAVSLQGGTEWILNLESRGGNFFDLPFPSELRRGPDGQVSVDDFPSGWGLNMVRRTKDAVDHGYGFTTAPTIFFRFTGRISESFPDPKTSMTAVSTIFLIDVDPNSPERGRRFPLLARFYPHGPSYMKFSPNLLAIVPVPGFALRENTLYAAGLLREHGDRAGRPLAVNQHLADLAAGNAPAGALGTRALETYGPAMAELAAQGTAPDQLAALTVFRTGDPTKRCQMLFDGVKDMTEFEWETPLARTREYDLYTVVEGAVMLPQFQDGAPPYGHGEGGRIYFDAAGKPVTQRMDRVPVAFSVPKGKMPAAGWPIMIYIHGTGGVSTQFIDRGEVTEDSPPDPNATAISKTFGGHGLAPEGTGPAMIFAHHGIAGVGAAQQHAGQRGGMDEQLYWYNFPSPEAFRDNMLQAVAEAAMLLRIVKGIEIDPALCPGTDTGGGPVRFDPQLIFGMGQSLGSLILGPWGAVETDLKVLIPSGNGAYWNIFVAEGNAGDLDSLQKRRYPQGKVLRLDRFHPFLALLFTVASEADPFAYQERYYKRPLPGRAPKHVYASFGILDNYFYPASQDAAILCMGLDFVGPVLEPSTSEALTLAGLKHLEGPVTQNAQSPDGPVTAVAAQFPEHGPVNGHHINFQRDDAKYQYGCFLESMVKDGVPTAFPAKDQWDAPCGP